MSTLEERLTTLEHNFSQFKTETVHTYHEMALDLTIVKGLTENSVRRITALKTEMEQRFELVDIRLNGMDAHLEYMGTRLDRMDSRLNGMDARLDKMDARLDKMDARLDSVDTRLNRVESMLMQILTRLPEKS
jgi:chaperonin cofactor prefoldin